MVQQYGTGMNACECKLAAISANFLHRGGQLTRQIFRGLLLTEQTPQGSNKRDEEEESFYNTMTGMSKLKVGINTFGSEMDVKD